jgi:hypothetical protein
MAIGVQRQGINLLVGQLGLSLRTAVRLVPSTPLEG